MKPKDLLNSVTSSINRPRRPDGFQRLDDSSQSISPIPPRKARRVEKSRAPPQAPIELTNFATTTQSSKNENNQQASAFETNSTSVSNNAATGTSRENRERRYKRNENDDEKNSLIETVHNSQSKSSQQNEPLFPVAEFHVYNSVTESLPESTDDAFPISMANVRLAFGSQSLRSGSSNIPNEAGSQSRGMSIRSIKDCILCTCHPFQTLANKHHKTCRIVTIILSVFGLLTFLTLSTLAIKWINMHQTSSHKKVQEYSMKILHNQSWPLQDVYSKKHNISFLKVSKEEELTNFKRMLEKVDSEGDRKLNASLTVQKEEHGDPYHPTINGKPMQISHELSINESYFLGRNILNKNLDKNGSELDTIRWKGLAGSISVAEMRERLNIETDTFEGTLPDDLCYKEPNVTCNATGWYRSIEGKCNHMFRKWGSLYSPFRRIINPQGKWKNHSHKIPGSYIVSKRIYWRTPHVDSTASVLLPMWGMFILQDTLKTATSPVNCCDSHHHSDSNNVSDNETISAICNITSAHFYTHGTSGHSHGHHEHEHHKCMEKSIPAQYPSCDFEPPSSFNLATSFIDASNIYGSTAETLDKLREREFGRLKQHAKDHHFQKLGFLPRETELNGSCLFSSPLNYDIKDCVSSGNADVNLIASLTALNTLFLRQHNRIAALLNHHNPHWDDEQLFQESRRILIAQIQHITFTEYLPQILGSELTKLAGLSLETGSNYYREHNRNVDPSVSTAYAGAVGYFWFSMLPEKHKLRLKIGNSIHDFLWDTNALILRPNFLANDKRHLEAVVRGMAATNANRVGLEIPWKLHKIFLKNSTEYVDLVRTAIEWGRDLDLPPYLEWRKVCGFPVRKTFDEFKKLWYSSAYATITSIYKNIEDVDLIIGMLAENLIDGGRVGPTLGCLLADQFLRFRKGDRYWYEGDVAFHHFTEEQLQAIRKTTLARIICDNVHEITEIQRWPMLIESPGPNPISHCSDSVHSIPKLNFLLWKEKPHSQDAYDLNNKSNVNVTSLRQTHLDSYVHDDSISQSESEEEALYESGSENNETNIVDHGDELF